MPARARCLILLVAISLLVPGPKVAGQAQADSGVRDKVCGAWKLVSIETIRANGEVIFPFYGKHPEGLITYDRSGWMSVQIVSDPPATVPAGDSREQELKGSDADKAKAFDRFYAYYGTWTLDPARNTVTHHIQQSLNPGERGEDGVRNFILDGDRLTLTVKTHEMGEDHTRKLVWQRLSQQ